MDARWYKAYVNMEIDDKFKAMKIAHGVKVLAFEWMFRRMLSYATKDGGWFRQGKDIPHDQHSLIAAFDWAVEFYGEEIIDTFISEVMKKGMVTKDVLGFYYVKNWEKYQHSALSTPRVQEHRERKQLESDITEVIQEINRVTKKNFRTTTEIYRKGIKGRFNDGYTKEQMLAVVRWKQQDWGSDPKQSKFVNPETLFRPGNFDRYLQEIGDDKVEAMTNGTMLTVENIYGKRLQITQEQYDRAEKGFFSIIQ